MQAHHLQQAVKCDAIRSSMVFPSSSLSGAADVRSVNLDTPFFPEFQAQRALPQLASYSAMSRDQRSVLLESLRGGLKECTCPNDSSAAEAPTISSVREQVGMSQESLPEDIGRRQPEPEENTRQSPAVR